MLKVYEWVPGLVSQSVSVFLSPSPSPSLIFGSDVSSLTACQLAPHHGVQKLSL